MQKMTEKEIVTLLKQRFYKSVCVRQCKLHVSWNTGKGRITVPNDGWKEFCLKQKNKYEKGSDIRQWWFSAWAKSYKSESPIMDLWILPRKWVNGEPICIEIKTSRSDLFNDHKFPDYWQACNYFYFAIPNGLITQEEMNNFPPQVGFMEVTKNQKGLRIKKKPCFMKEPINPDIYRYILMWRVRIVKSRFDEFRRKKRRKK